MKRVRLDVIAAVALLAILSGAPAAGPTSPADGASLVWPPPPAAPGVRFVRSIATPADWGIGTTLFGRIADAIGGKSDDRFVRPTGVTERDGVLYVADPGAPALWILDARENRVLKIDHLGDARLVSPVAVAPGPEGTVFVADSVLKQVFAVDSGGRRLGVAAAQGLERPVGLVFDAQERNLYVADSVAHRVSVFGPDGALIRSFGGRGAGDGELNGPAYLALGRDGTLLVTDAFNFRVTAFDRTGQFRWKMGRAGDGSGDFAAPKGIALDAAGHLYVVDALFDVVQVFDARGSLLFAFGQHGAGAGEFWLAGGLFISPQDDIYVADSYNRRIQHFRQVNDAAERGAR